MSARVQSSPFRETEWDQRLDRMLDDLKSTVTDDEDRRTPVGVRSSSRSSSRAGSTGRYRAGSSDGVTDGGRLTHHRKEYTSPDQAVRTVADTYQYDSGDTHPSGNFQKKVVKSTYSSYNVDGGLSSDLDSLKRGPSDREMERALTQESRNILNNTSYTNNQSTTTTNSNSKVIDASQEVARELVGALSCIGSDSESEDQKKGYGQSSQSSLQSSSDRKKTTSYQSSSARSHYTTGAERRSLDNLTAAKNTSTNLLKIEENIDTSRNIKNTSSNGNDYSTLGRLRKNIKELGSMIDDMDGEEMDRMNRKYLGNASSLQQVDKGYHSEGNINTCSDLALRHDSKTRRRYDAGRDGRSLSNGHLDDDMTVNDEKGGEVRRIVWRNRYEKTYEAQDPNAVPTVSIEKDSKNRRYNTSGTDINDTTTISSLTRPHVPPQISPGGQSWAEPVPLPTPPQQVSPREPGVAYIYNYGSSGGSAVQPLPPLNYVSVAPPVSEGAPSPTPSAVTTGGQPVIYHYSYHYTIQPGQSLPEGAHPPSSPPTLQIVPPPATGYSQSTNASNINKSTTINEIRQSTTTNKDIHHHHTTDRTIINRSKDPLDPLYPHDGKPSYPGDGKPGYPGDDKPGYPGGGKPGYPGDGKPGYPGDGKPGYPGDGKPGYPGDGKPGYPGDGKPGYPGDGKPGYPGSGKPDYPGDGKPGYPVNKTGPTSINYSVNATNFHTESHHHPFPTSPSEKTPRDPSLDNRNPPGHPNDPNRNITININKSTTHTTRTSTRDGEYPPNDNQVPITSTPYRGGSRSPDRHYPHEPRYPSGPSDSLERVRRPQHSGLPFPDTSPVKPQDPTRIPRKVDDLMTEFPEKNGGPYRHGYNAHPESELLLSGSNSRHTRTEVSILPPERNDINTVSPQKLREERDKSKNLAGPPVYYPPGHEQFSETMHTMTLKEGGRRGNAKWRREAASGYKESSSASESKGGVAMVPVCLPLCCGAACTIM